MRLTIIMYLKRIYHKSNVVDPVSPTVIPCIITKSSEPEQCAFHRQAPSLLVIFYVQVDCRYGLLAFLQAWLKPPPQLRYVRGLKAHAIPRASSNPSLQSQSLKLLA